LILGTIKENMKFANQGATDEDIDIALNKANA
jgi:ABC-type multidrug transport system fused ATPase/permease subunit